MNWTFSNPAILIFIFLFCFSILSLGFYLDGIYRLLPLRKKAIRDSRIGQKPSEDEVSLFFSPLERKLQWLPTISSISMLLGLLGTVIGISSSFSQMELSGKVSLEVLASGIRDALHTTIGGLVVAIPSIVFHRSLENLIQEISELILNDEVKDR
ncbi:MAG: MotA/TolQ/ExbB proton channel family protein [Leptospira sp.]|nr:MotA/TolQ/ExbB proton channel family protein [Leptospira sp.]